MKKLLIALIVLTSCHKCMECKQTVTTTTSKPVAGYPKTDESITTLCDEDLQQMNGKTYTSQATASNGNVITSTSTTNCY